MAVYQGDIVQLLRISDSSIIGWYQKLRDGKKNVNFYCLENENVISSREVLEDGSNTNYKNYKVIRRLTGDNIQKVLKIDCEEAYDLSLRSEISASMETVNSKIDSLNNLAEKRLGDYQEVISLVGELNKVKDKLIRGEKFKYLYASFPNSFNPNKEYCWIISDDLSFDFSPGEMVTIVDNYYMTSFVMVRRVEESYEYIDHKVISYAAGKGEENGK